MMVITYGCNTNFGVESTFKIPVQYNMENTLPFSESGYTYDVEIIPLENKTEAYVNFKGINRIEVYKDIYYIMSFYGDLKLFHKNGNYLKTISKGRGPGELNMVSDFSFDRDTEKIEILDVNDIKVYDIAGNYETSIPVKNNYIEFVKFGKKRIFLDSNKDPQQKYNYIILNNAGELSYFEDKFGPTLSPTISPRHFNQYEKELYLSSNYSNKIYKMVADDKLPKEFGYIEEMNTDKSISGIDFESFKEISSRNNWFTKVLGFYKINSSMYGLSISKDRIETFLVDLSRNLIYYHPFNGLPILFKPLFSCGLKEYYLFPPELFQGAAGDLINKKNPELYTKIKEQILPETDAQNLFIIKLTYREK